MIQFDLHIIFSDGLVKNHQLENLHSVQVWFLHQPTGGHVYLSHGLCGLCDVWKEFFIEGCWNEFVKIMIDGFHFDLHVSELLKIYIYVYCYLFYSVCYKKIDISTYARR